MLARLLELKEFCETMAPLNPDLHLSPIEWQGTLHISKALLPSRKLCIALQKEQLTAGDFFQKLASM